KIIAIVRLNEIEIDSCPNFLFGINNITSKYLTKSPLGQTPAFETKDGIMLTESATILSHTTYKKKNSALLGNNTKERSKIH
ncbi:hypothetical protein K502DRAFT_288572, partial [Neoconidiobolus thromboides FSU 785]